MDFILRMTNESGLPDEKGGQLGIDHPIVQPSKLNNQSGDKSDTGNQTTGQPDRESGNQLNQPGDKPAIWIDFESGNQPAAGNENLK